jgi:hypothetical protein
MRSYASTPPPVFMASCLINEAYCQLYHFTVRRFYQRGFRTITTGVPDHDAESVPINYFLMTPASMAEVTDICEAETSSLLVLKSMQASTRQNVTDVRNSVPISYVIMLEICFLLPSWTHSRSVHVLQGATLSAGLISVPFRSILERKWRRCRNVPV